MGRPMPMPDMSSVMGCESMWVIDGWMVKIGVRVMGDGWSEKGMCQCLMERSLYHTWYESWFAICCFS